MPDRFEPFTSEEAFDAHRIRALAIYCSDGRYGEQFDDFLHNHLNLPRYDRLAVPGGPACLTGHYSNANVLAGIRDQIRFLIDAHGLEQIVLIQHHGCAFYANARGDTDPQAMRPDQDQDLARAKAEILRMHPTLIVMTAHARLHNNQVSFERVLLNE